MAAQQLLHFCRGNSFAGSANHIFLAADERVPPALIDANEVAGMIPAAAQGVRRGVGIIEVSGKKPGPAHQQLSGRSDGNFAPGLVNDPQLQLRQANPHRSGADHLLGMLPGNADIPACLGAAIAVDERDAKPIHQLPVQIGRDRRADGHLQLMLPLQGMRVLLEQQDRHRSDQVEFAHPVVDDDLPKPRYAESPHGNQRTAEMKGAQQLEHRVRVVERHAAERTISARVAG